MSEETQVKGEHAHMRAEESGLYRHTRASDAFVARWARRLAYMVLAGVTPLAGYLWSDREAKINVMNSTVADLKLVNVRISELEKRVDTQNIGANADRAEIKEELRALRGEVKQMYIRAIQAGGRNP